jgi:hypothetical protein
VNADEERAGSTWRRDGAASRRRSSGLAAVAAAAAVVLAGCGGSKAPSVASLATTTSSSAGGNTDATSGGASSGSPSSQAQLQQESLKYARCMRANGVPKFPDPSAGGGFPFHLGGGVDPSSPVFKAARAKCQKFMPIGGGLAPGTTTHPSAGWLAHMVKVSQCMRRRGITDFPDPRTSIPSDAFAGGNGMISNIDGVILVFPSTIDTQSPEFIRAARACGFPFHNH